MINTLISQKQHKNLFPFSFILTDCCEPLAGLVEFGVDLVGFSHVVGYWHKLRGCMILYCCIIGSMYIHKLWIYNCGDYINAL